MICKNEYVQELTNESGTNVDAVDIAIGLEKHVILMGNRKNLIFIPNWKRNQKKLQIQSDHISV